MSTDTNPSWPIVVLRLPVTGRGLITFSKAVHDRTEGHPAFPNPEPSMPELAGYIAALDAAETKVPGGGPGAATARNARRNELRRALRRFRDHVQKVADAQPDPTSALALIQSILLDGRRKNSFSPRPIQVRTTGTSGEVEVRCRRVQVTATYFWEHSVDQETWTLALETMKVSAKIGGLTPGQRYYFRFRTLDRKGNKTLSSVVPLIVQ